MEHIPPFRAMFFAAKIGFITREIWREYFFENANARVERRSWKQLIDRGYFMPHPNMRLKGVLILNRKKPLVLRTLQSIGLNKIVSAPYEKMVLHDELLGRGILEAEKSKLLLHWTTEAELKSENLRQFRIGVEGKKSKYPDAILKYNLHGEYVLSAIEIERTMKDQSRYKTIMSNYSHIKGVALLLFVTPNEAIRDAIRQAATKSFFAPQGMRVGFMDLTDWQKKPMGAAIDFKSERISLLDYLDQSVRGNGKLAA